MKSSSLTLFAVLACSVAMAQSQSDRTTTSSSSSTQQSAGSASQSFQGCLQQSDGGFTLNDSGTQYRVVGGDKSELRKLSGHTVSLTGEKTGNEIAVQSAQDVSSTCETSTTNSTTGTPSTSTGPTEDQPKSSGEPKGKDKPPMSEEPPMGPPHSHLLEPAPSQPEALPIGSATSSAIDAANSEAANATKPLYEEAVFDPQNQTAAGEAMPQSSSELPLLGAIGFGILAVGFWRRS